MSLGNLSSRGLSHSNQTYLLLCLLNKSLTLIWKTTYPLLAVWHFLQVTESISSIRWLWPLTKKACHYRSFYKRWQYLEIQQGWWIRSRGAGEEGAREEGSRHLKSTPDREPPAHSVIPYPRQSGPATFSQTVPPPQHPSPLSQHGTHPSAKSAPGPAPRRVGVAAREGASGLWAGGVRASLGRWTVSSRGGSGAEQGNQVTAEKGPGATRGWRGKPLP